MPSPTGPVARLLARLAALRGRIRRIYVLAGASRWVATAVVAVAFVLVADAALNLPIEVRRFLRLGLLDRPAWLGGAAWAFLLGTALLATFLATRARSRAAAPLAFVALGLGGLLVWVAVRGLVDPLRARLSDEDLALTVEERFRRLNDRLVAALDFDRELADPRRGESAPMMERVVEEAGREAEGIEFARVASSRAAWRRAGAAAAAAAAFAALVLAFPATARLAARRTLLLEDVAWPRSTTVLLVLRDAAGVETEADPSRPIPVALGRPFLATARARGEVPAEVFLYDRLPGEPASSKPLARPLRAVPDRPGLFEVEFRDVRGDFEFFLRGGDDEDDVPVYTVSVRVPPRIASVSARLTFPDYLGLPARDAAGGELRVPEGTEVAVSFKTDADLATADVRLGDAALPVEGGPRAFRFAFRATASTRWWARLVTRDGRENDPATDTYEVTVEADAKPVPEWVHPRAPLEATPTARLPLFARTTDDHSVDAIRLEIKAAASERVEARALALRDAAHPEAENDRPYGAEEILSYLPLEVAGVLDEQGRPPAAPARLLLRLVARDRKGQEGESEWVPVDLLPPDELERSLASRRTSVKSEVAALHAEQAQVRETTGGIVPGTDVDATRTALREVHFKQGKIRADVERAARALTTLFDAYVADRLGARVPTDRILALADRFHRAAFSRGASAAGGTAASPTDTVFPWALYREVVAARRERRFFDTGVLDKLITVVEGAVDAADGAAPAAAAAAAEAAAPEAGSAQVTALVAAQDRCLASLRRTLDAMQEWQSLSELVLDLRHIIEEQEALHLRIAGAR